MQNRFPERRQRVRVLTLKNLARFVIVAVVVFIAVNLWSEVRGRHAKEYGRLYSHELKSTPQVKPQLDVVQEAPAVADRVGSDPMLLAPAAREEKYLTATPPAPVGAPVAVRPIQAAAASGDRITISNEGVGVVVTGEHRLLRGGFGR